jgi:hypothetical protein
VSDYVAEIVMFGVANAAWMLLVVAAVALWRLVPILVVLAPLLALPTSALMRLAVVTVRYDTPAWRHVRDELGRLVPRKLLLASVQLLLTAMGIANISLAVVTGGVLGAITGLVAFYAVLVVSLYALALWPIVADPAQEAPLREQLRLATALVLTRTLPLLLLLVVTVLAIILSVQLIVPAVILPSLVMLAVAAYVVPIVDRARAARRG